MSKVFFGLFGAFFLFGCSKPCSILYLREAEHKQKIEEAKHLREQEKHEAEMAQLRGQATFNAVQHAKKS